MPVSTNADVWDDFVSDHRKALGWTFCASGAYYGGSDAAHTRWCRRQIFQYNTYWAQYFSTDPLKRYIACHELGHTFGLQHPKSNEPQATCMKSASADLSYVPTYNYISATEKNQIDLYYGSGQVSP